MTSHLHQQNWKMAWMLVKQELLDRYRGNMLGILWLFVQPLALILIFTVVFSNLMGSRLQSSTDPFSYSIYLVSGLLIWNAQANILVHMSGVYQNKAHLIKKVAVNLFHFPLYIALVELMTWLISMTFFLIYLWWVDRLPDLQLLAYILLVLLPSMCASYWGGVVLALLTPFLPDLRSAWPIFMQWFFWATPIVYLPNVLPEYLRHFLDWNVLYWAPRAMQDILLFQVAPSTQDLMFFWLVVLALYGLARYLRIRLEKGLRDLL